jgi:UDP-glucose 4-epimerase
LRGRFSFPNASEADRNFDPEGQKMILVTGGAGYIGSHACAELLESGERVVVFDNFSTSHRESVQRVQKICGKSLVVVEGDVRDQRSVEDALTEHGCTAVMHFAGLKAVHESVTAPLDYYENNVIGTYYLLRAMQRKQVRRIIFSSSATVYGVPQFLPYTEDHPLRPINPYGRTKLVIEDMLRDLYASDQSWGIGILRYFNPVGAHQSGLIGEDPRGIPNNLLPFIAQVAVGRREALNVWGGDYDTPDGTGIRDYIHVMDLAAGHVAALRFLDHPKCFAVNLGTGTGSSVLDVIKAFERASGKKISFEIRPRREGDLDAFYAATNHAYELLGWRATRSLDTMCIDHWRWQTQNPQGYA